MSKRKNRQPAKPAPVAPPVQKPSAPAPTPASVKPASTSALVYLVPIVLVVLMGGALVLWLTRPSSATPNPITTSTATPQQRRTNIGRTTACQRNPNFSESVGLGKQVVASTANGNRKGLLMFSPSAPDKFYQHPTWISAGNLGQFVVDGAGNTYVVPAVEISVSPEILALQSTLFKVDTNTSEMATFITLPVAAKTTENPFGLMGLAYDCDTNSVYATSVAGSTSADEVGRIYRIDANTAQVAGQLDNVDAMGIGVFNGAFGKRLYFGKARTPEVYSVALTDAGTFTGEPRFEFALSEVPNGQGDQARRIQINDKREMTIRAWPFDFNLRAASETPKRAYKFKYNEANDQWDFMSVEPITGVTAN